MKLSTFDTRFCYSKRSKLLYQNYFIDLLSINFVVITVLHLTNKFLIGLTCLLIFLAQFVSSNSMKISSKTRQHLYNSSFDSPLEPALACFLRMTKKASNGWSLPSKACAPVFQTSRPRVLAGTSHSSIPSGFASQSSCLITYPISHFLCTFALFWPHHSYLICTLSLLRITFIKKTA